MKKILVSGCSNCPYLTAWNDGNGNGIDSICNGSCNHPSFSKELGAPRFSRNILLKKEGGGNDSYLTTIANGTPNWCPLPEDTKPIYVINDGGVNIIK